MLDDRKKYYEKANVRVATDDLSPEVTAEEIINILSQL
jgi:shikimate kinase